MSYATDDAELLGASKILYACRGKIASDIRREASRALPDARRLADLELLMSQLRDDIAAVRAGDRAVTTRVRAIPYVSSSDYHPDWLLDIETYIRVEALQQICCPAGRRIES